MQEAVSLKSPPQEGNLQNTVQGHWLIQQIPANYSGWITPYSGGADSQESWENYKTATIIITLVHF